MVDKISDLLLTKRIEIDHGEGSENEMVDYFDLNLAMDEIAEIVALDLEVNTHPAVPAVDLMLFGMSCWFSLDPDDDTTTKGENSDDTLVYRETKGWWKNITGEQEAGQTDRHGEMIHFPPGIYTAVNPIFGTYKTGVESRAEANACLYYRIKRPTVNELAGIVARRR